MLIILWARSPASTGEIVSALAAENKLRLFDFSLAAQRAFLFARHRHRHHASVLREHGAGPGHHPARFLACRRIPEEGQGALFASVFAGIPVVFLFLMIGSLLHIVYDRADLMGHAAGAAGAGTFGGEKITIFMHYILTQIPPGVRGFVAVGVLAAAAVGLISMSSVLIQDFYRPWVERRGPRPEVHYVRAGRIGMLVLALALLGMSYLCFYWQRYTDAPLLDFALGVMTFAYSGLLGVYFTLLFTKRGSTVSVIAALATGFIAIALQQSYIVDMLGLPSTWKSLAFPYQLCIGTAVAFATCLVGNRKAPETIWPLTSRVRG